jgi:hypothetical protein
MKLWFALCVTAASLFSPAALANCEEGTASKGPR